MSEQDPLGTVLRVDASTGKVKIMLQGKLYIGDTIALGKGDSMITHKVENMTLEGIRIEKGFTGDVIELEIAQPVDPDSTVYKIG